MKALGINIFGGGFTLGVIRAGYTVIGQWEECNAHARTFDMNKKYFSGIHRPIGRENWPELGVPHLNLIYANPPCAPWSNANASRTTSERMADSRLSMTANTMNTALALRPDAFVLESVAAAFKRGAAYYDAWAEKFMAAGYGVTYLLTDALLHGVPQTRERFHFIAHRARLNLTAPDMRSVIPKTVRMAIGDLKDDFNAKWQHAPRRLSDAAHALLSKSPPGCTVRNVSIELGMRDYKPSAMMRRLAWDAPSYTVVGFDDKLVHPERHRVITWREGMRLCGYPDDFMLSGPSAATQAVLPPMGKLLAGIARDASGRADIELMIVDWRDLAKPYRVAAVLRNE